MIEKLAIVVYYLLKHKKEDTFVKTLSAEWSGRLSHWIHTLKKDFYHPLRNIEFSGFFTKEHLKYEEAKAHKKTPIKTGTVWGESYEYLWLFAEIELPKEAKGERIVMDLGLGGEATVFVDDRAFGTYRADWISDKHHFICDNFLTKSAKEGQKFLVALELYAGHFYPQSELGGCATGPVLPGSYQNPKKEGERSTINACSFGIWNEEAYQLYMDVSTLNVLFECQDDKTLRAAKLAEALESFTLIVDFEQNIEKRLECYHRARQALKPALSCVNGSTAPIFYAIGNAHIDITWLWPMFETERKTARTFAAQLRLLEEYPDYKFIQSQPCAYSMCKEYYPELYARIQEAAKQGRWIPEGAMWVEPDTNMSSGEALIRQILHGKRYFKEEFNVDSKMLWLPDTFGYSAVLPQILKGCGIDYLVTQKIFWTYNDAERFPYHYFTWKGVDGSSIDSFLPTSYTYQTMPRSIIDAWNSRSQKRDLEAFLFPYGYGDGGGGPCRDYIEYLEREKDLEGMPKTKMESPIKFFSDMEEQGGPKNTYVGELYFTAHRGVYTSQAKTKKGNRKSELMLREAEFIGALAEQRGYRFPYDKMDRLWKIVLTNQFHDILPGSSIGKVYEKVEKDYSELQAELSEIIADMKAFLAKKNDSVSVINSLSFERNELIELDESFKNGAKLSDGTELELDTNGDRVCARLNVPALSSVSISPSSSKKLSSIAKARLTSDGAELENDEIIVKLNSLAEIISLRDKKSNREFVKGKMNELLMYKDVARLFDAWDIDSNYELQGVELSKTAKLSIKKSEGLSAVLTVEREIGESKLCQDIVIKAGSKRLDFETKVDWRELHRLLKVGFGTDVLCENGINEIQFGFMERPTHKSRLYDKDRFEVCNHRYSALCDNSHGVAVLNDCKYGISMHTSELRLTLLKSASCPEMRADNGEQSFTYSVFAWEGSFADSSVVEEAYKLNNKPQIVKGELDEKSFAELNKRNIFIDSIKPAEDKSGDIILRLYEAKKASTSCILTFNKQPNAVFETDMLENIKEELKLCENSVGLSFRAFEIKTLRLKF